MKILVNPTWLKANINDPDLVVLNATQVTNVSNKVDEFSDQQIPGARFFDLKNTFSDQQSNLPNTVPSEADFEEGCRKLGINASSKIVVYDNLGVYFSPRVWWMFKTMGHDNVSILDGGFPSWIQAGFPTEKNSETEFEPGNFKAKLDPSNIRNFEQIKSNIQTKKEVVIDARSKGRFDGTEPEPRKDLQSGHIPNSVNLPYSELLNDNHFKSKAELQAIFDAKKVDPNAAMVFTCGSGLTACIVLVAAEIALENRGAVYDGSWTEWATKMQLKSNI